MRSPGTLIAMLAICCTASAVDVPLPKPERREILVPAKDLPAVLEKNPRAVALTREQYETLLRDAQKHLKASPESPRRAVLTSARYEAELHGKVVEVRADFVVHVLSDKWAEVPLRLGALALGEVEVDGESALQAGGKDAHTLIVRGRGEHRLRAHFTLPVQRDSAMSSIALALPVAGAGSFTLKLPPRTHVESAHAVKIENTAAATLATVAASATTDFALAWRAESDSAGSAPVIFEADSFLYVIDETKVQADLGIVLNASLGELPASFRITLPTGTTPLSVQGSEVLKWNAVAEVVTVELTPGSRKTAALRVLVETSAFAGKKAATLVLPTPEVSGVHRAIGKMAVIGSREIKVRAIHADEPSRQTEGAFSPQIEGDANFVAAYQFPARAKPLAVTVEKIAPRFSVDLDTLIDVRREAIFLERTVALTADEGELFSADIGLPQGEELLTVREGDAEPDWTRAAGKIHLRWPDAVAVGGRKTFTIKTRIEPAAWATVKEFALAISDAKVEGAEKINGYIAAKSDEAFRIETRTTDGLERRDGRVTPVRGDFAWFRRSEFKLALQVARRTPEVRAAFTGYALPLAGALSVRAEIGYDIDFSGVKVFRVKVPKETAEQFYFDGDGIAERKLDGDTWTITLQKETLGHYALKVNAMLPFTRGADAKFEIAAPTLVPLDVQRERGTWVVEANTDTEIAFQTSGMNEIDSLRAPALSDYQPQHRIIGVFEYLGGAAHNLKLLGERHATATLLTTVVDSLELNSVIAPSGVDRHEAIFSLRTAGDQFLDIALPGGASLLSLAVDGAVVKPVGETANVVRVQLAAQRECAARIQLIYETPKRTWSSTGTDTLPAPRLDARIPVLRTNWHLFLPDGFSFTGFETNLHEREKNAERVLMSKVMKVPASVLGSLVFKPKFFSKATIEVKADNYREGGAAFGANDRVFDPRFVLTQFQIIQKTQILYPVIDRLKLEERWAENGMKLSRGAAHQRLLQKLELREVRNTELVEIGVHDGDAQLAADIANAISAEYIAQRRKIQEEMVGQGLRQLEESVAEQRRAMQEAGAKAAKLRAEMGLIDPDPENVTPTEIEIGGVKTKARVAAYDEAKSAYISEKRLFEAAAQALKAEEMKMRVTTIPAQIHERAEPAAAPSHFFSFVGAFGGKQKSGSIVDAPVSESAPLAHAPATPRATPLPGNRSGSFAITENAVDALLAGSGQMPLGLNPLSAYLEQARVFFQSGRYDLAFQKCEEILAYDSSNIEARTLMGKIKLARDSAAIAGYNEARSKALWQEQNRWGYAVKGEKIAGLLPVQFELPLAGRRFDFDGLYAPDQVKFRYANWWFESRIQWILFAVGAFAFVFFGHVHPWFRMVLGVLVLTFVPLVVTPLATGVCNALLVGWLVSFVLSRVASRFVFRRRVVEVTAPI